VPSLELRREGKIQGLLAGVRGGYFFKTSIQAGDSGGATGRAFPILVFPGAALNRMRLSQAEGRDNTGTQTNFAHLYSLP